MTYKVVTDFKDLRDDGYEYKNGDKYPHSGTADPERAHQLMTPTPQRGPLIEVAAEEKTTKVAKEVKETKPVAKKKQEK